MRVAAVEHGTIQPLPSFSEIYAAALKALNREIEGAGQPIEA